MPLSYLPPTDQVYQCHVPERYYGFPLAEYFAARFDYLDREAWTARIGAGMVSVNGAIAGPDYILRPHDHIVTRLGPFHEPPADRTLNLIYEDAQLRVFNKAAPIPVHPSGRYFKNSMTELLKEIYPGEIPRPVQRLDCTTTGVIVFARDRDTAARFTEEFTANRVRKDYLALVDGVPERERFTVDLPIGKVKGMPRIVGGHTPNSKPAYTEARLLSVIGGRSLLQITPQSGRTNQIRVHLASAGLPVVNDRVYGKNRLPAHGAVDYAAGSLEFGLHAWKLAFRLDGREFEFVAPWPEHFSPFIEAAGYSFT